MFKKSLKKMRRYQNSLNELDTYLIKKRYLMILNKYYSYNLTKTNINFILNC